MNVRPRRSILYVPGSNARALEEARGPPADGLILDLEDAVAPSAKEEPTSPSRRARAPTRSFVWAIFTVTHDIDADFPARCARLAGWGGVPMICSREIPVPGSMPRVIRRLLQVDRDGPRNHVYLSGAQALRPDLLASPV